MDLKDYREMPDNGLFEKIARRVRRRRMMRLGGVAVGVVAVATVLCMVLWPSVDNNQAVDGRQVAMQQKSVVTIPAVSAENNEAVLPAMSEAPVVGTQKQQPKTQKGDSVEVVFCHEEQPMEMAEVTMPAVQPQVTPVVKSETKAVAEPRKPMPEVAKVQTEKAVSQTDNESRPTTAPIKSDPAEEPPLHEDNLFWAPNVIVPGGDVDVNRTFSMKFTSAVTNFQIYIYNRGGRQVYHSSDPTFVWDGTMKGTALSQGAYIWVVKFRDMTGKLHEERGTVTIIR